MTWTIFYIGLALYFVAGAVSAVVAHREQLEFSANLELFGIALKRKEIIQTDIMVLFFWWAYLIKKIWTDISL